MARPLRVQYAGAIYHVMNRGDRREAVFKDNKDHERFLQTLAEACARTGWQIHAWCLMKNHFHLVIETPQPNLAAGMKWFLGTYTGRFNRRHKFFGHLFGGRYKALAVDGSGNGYLRTICDYVHLNPVRAGLIKGTQSLEAHRWSSFNDYLKGPRKRPVWLRTDRLFGEMGIGADTTVGRRRFEDLMEQRRAQEKDQDLAENPAGLVPGQRQFSFEIAGSNGGEVQGLPWEAGAAGERRRTGGADHPGGHGEGGVAARRPGEETERRRRKGGVGAAPAG